ncbi:MAG: hypothetical protein ACC661_01920 [Verrucomicrobiales bacterium]
MTGKRNRLKRWRVAVGTRGRRRLWPLAVAFSLVLAALISAADLGEFFSRGIEIRPAESLTLPGEGSLWGRDEAGRDLGARVMIAAGASLAIAAVVFAITAGAGLLLGILASRLPRPLRGILAWLYRGWFCYPVFTLLLVFSMVPFPGEGLSRGQALGALGALVVSFRVWRVIERISLHDSTKAGIVCGMSPVRAWLRCRAGYAVAAALASAARFLPMAILWNAALGFVIATRGGGERWPGGLGAVIAEARPYLLDAPWLMVPPGVALTLMIALAHGVAALSRNSLCRRLELLDDCEYG